MAVAVVYAYEHPRDRAPHYAAAFCFRCMKLDGLMMRGGVFVCEFCYEYPSPERLYWPPSVRSCPTPKSRRDVHPAR